MHGLITEEEKMSVADVKEHIRLLESGYGAIRNAKLIHMRLLLKYKYTLEKHILGQKIKRNLGIYKVGGSFTKEQTAQALGMTERQGVSCENKALKLLKRPGTGKALKNAFIY